MNSNNTLQDDREFDVLILAGQGYDLTIATEAEARKAELLEKSETFLAVSSNDESAAAQRMTRSLAAMRIGVEKARKAVKEPVNRIGKMVDETAKNFLAELVAEENRIAKLVGAHAEEVARKKRELEAEERRKADEARRAREEAEAAAEKAAESGKIADVIAARKAAEERAEAARENLTIAGEVARTKVAEGVRFAWDFEVESIEKLYFEHPELVKLEAKRSEVLAWIKASEEEGFDPVKIASIIGIRAFKKPIVSSR